MESASYITSEEAARTTSEQGLLPETKLLIDCAAKSIASHMLVQLEQAALVSHQYTGNEAMMQGRTSVDVYDGVVRQMFHSDVLHAFTGLAGMKTPTIIVDISAFLDGDNELTDALKRNNFSLVPVRLIQTSERPLTREATTEYAKEFSVAVKDAFSDALANAADVRPGELFVRQQMLHRGKHDIAESADCCIFKIFEEDYKMPYDRAKLDNNAYKYVQAQSKAVADGVFKHQVAEFSIKCGRPLEGRLDGFHGG
ncbi:hypothetical protein P171DRAFT_441555 [Karstenula rhodostoma CBS 690.94]|uniref:Uncharacterized protein n=1 Tax=Karstenula rhodostoma CBS 690.94 TaxID=1392251 RepID=A0A9P4PP18_9PLEO|nr:hypothetical protein P171DRAFT_441555 [Karstenula rhodostoma CBS 690.94]